MNKLKVEVLGGKPPKPPEGWKMRLRRALQSVALAAIQRPKTVMLTFIVGFPLLIGTPHVGGDYQCSHAVWGYGACQAPLWCEYYGVQGRRVIWPESGEHCHLFKLMTLDVVMLIEGLRDD
jgi:hypothetical protein